MIDFSAHKKFWLLLIIPIIIFILVLLFLNNGKPIKKLFNMATTTKMSDTKMILANNPMIGFIATLIAFITPFISAVLPIVQLLVAVVGLIIGLLTVEIKRQWSACFKEWTIYSKVLAK